MPSLLRIHKRNNRQSDLNPITKMIKYDHDKGKVLTCCQNHIVLYYVILFMCNPCLFPISAVYSYEIQLQATLVSLML